MKHGLQDMEDDTLFEHPHYIPARKIVKGDIMESPAERAVALYKHISQFVNGDRAYTKMISDELCKDHLLLQAYVVGLMLDMIKAMAENPYVRAQNEKAVKLCQEIMEVVGDYPEYL